MSIVYVSWLSLSSNSGSVEMWKYVFIVLIYLITLEMWKCGNVEICLHCLNLSNNSGSVEMWKYIFVVFISYLWKCGNVEICLQCLYLITLEVWKCENMSSLS